MYRICLATALLAGMTLSAAAEYSLTILHINDLHSRIEPINKYDSTCSAEDDAEGKCFGGFARVATAINARREALRAEGKNVLTLDAGDQFQGSLFYSTYKGAVAVEFMNVVGFDAMAVGNHEFDDGPEALATFLDKAEFPVISGNTNVSANNRLAERVPGYIILDVGGEKIGIVSVLATDTAETSSPGPSVTFEDEIAYLQRIVPEIEAAGVNKIIALTHVGLPADARIAAAVSGVDVIVGGHSHTLLSNTHDRALGPYPTMITNPDGVEVPIVQAYAYSKFLGEIEITFDDAGAVTAATGDTILIDASFEPDAAIAARVTELGAPIEELKQKVVAEAAELIDGQRESCRAVECAMGNLVADAMLDRVKDQGVTIAIQNGGGLRASIDAGEITMGEVLTVLPFQNTLSTFQLKGADIVAALENGVSQVEEGAGRFPQVAGLKYTWSRAGAPNESRIVEVLVAENDGFVPIDPAKVYSVVSNNYMRAGGDGYKIFANNAENAYDYGPGLEQVVADYLAGVLAESGPYKPYVDGRIAEK